MIRIISVDDQDVFARLSGDYNPIHLDPVVARRLLFGQLTVHGIHTLLGALDAWLGETNENVRLKSLKVNFRRPVIVDEPVEVAALSRDTNKIRIDVAASGVKLLTANVFFEPGTSGGIHIPPDIPSRGPCRDRTGEDFLTVSGRLPLCLDPRMASRLFPNALRLLPAEQVATLLAATRLVGMEVPGLHSVFTGLDLRDSSGQDGPELFYQTDSFEDRYSRLDLRIVAPGFSGKVSAMVRPAPKKQATLVEIRSRTVADEFRGERALVIGGSRGLGEVAVKELAAGGADVKFSYHKGAADAEGVRKEIVSGGGTVSCFQYDVRADAAKLPSLVGNWSPTLLCYFATPFITAGTDGRFSYSRFLEFSACYVEGFLNTFHAARGLGSDLKIVLFPSSFFIDELPLNMGEYSAAKSAGEVLCHFLEKAHPGVRIHCPRLPRLATDQTASVLPTEIPDGAATILRILREVRSSGIRSREE